MYRAPFITDRIIASSSYITMGMTGFLWLIISLFTKNRLQPFIMYHIIQSIFISLGFTVISIFLGFISNILSVIPFIRTLVANLAFLLNSPFIFDYSFIQVVVYLLLAYLAVTSLIGKYSYIPWVSDIIEQNVRR